MLEENQTNVQMKVDEYEQSTGNKNIIITALKEEDLDCERIGNLLSTNLGYTIDVPDIKCTQKVHVHPQKDQISDTQKVTAALEDNAMKNTR